MCVCEKFDPVSATVGKKKRGRGGGGGRAGRGRGGLQIRYDFRKTKSTVQLFLFPFYKKKCTRYCIRVIQQTLEIKGVGNKKTKTKTNRQLELARSNRPHLLVMVLHRRRSQAGVLLHFKRRQFFPLPPPFPPAAVIRPPPPPAFRRRRRK